MKTILATMVLTITSTGIHTEIASAADTSILLQADNTESSIQELEIFVDETGKISVQLLDFSENCEICKENKVVKLFLNEFSSMPYIHTGGLSKSLELAYGESLGFPIPARATHFRQNCSLSNWGDQHWELKSNGEGGYLEFSRIEETKRSYLAISCQYEYVFPYGGIYTGYPVKIVSDPIITNLFPK